MDLKKKVLARDIKHASFVLAFFKILLEFLCPWAPYHDARRHIYFVINYTFLYTLLLTYAFLKHIPPPITKAGFCIHFKYIQFHSYSFFKHAGGLCTFFFLKMPRKPQKWDESCFVLVSVLGSKKWLFSEGIVHPAHLFVYPQLWPIKAECQNNFCQSFWHPRTPGCFWRKWKPLQLISWSYKVW